MAKIIVTGAGGFLGSHTVNYLRTQGHNVTAFTQLSFCQEDPLGDQLCHTTD